ncbi:MAG: hypothetical protein R3D32_15590 [Nitratireductor sp.]
MTNKIGSNSGLASRSAAAGTGKSRSPAGAGEGSTSRFLFSVEASREVEATGSRSARRDIAPRTGEGPSKPVVYSTAGQISYREAVDSMAGKPAQLSAMIERGDNQHKMLNIAIVASEGRDVDGEPAALPLLQSGNCRHCAPYCI